MRSEAYARPSLMTHPMITASICVLLLNDHWLKHVHRSWLTGKLSDVAGLIFFPVLLHTVFAFAIPRLRGRAGLVALSLVTAVVFALIKCSPDATRIYRLAWGAMQWPWAALSAALEGRPVGGIRRVMAVTDPTDLIAVPFAFLACALLQRGDGRTLWSVPGPSSSERGSAPAPGRGAPLQVRAEG